MPLFSVIMPVYNAEKTLNKSIQSVLNQSMNDFELITINDGSTDKSLLILELFSKENSNIRIINQSNLGPGIARNKGITVATGKYIAFLDADDYWEPDFFDIVLKASNNEKADYIYIEMVKETVNGKILARTNVINNLGLTKQQMLCRQMTGKMPWGMSKVIRRDILYKSQGKFMNFSVGEENVFSFEALKASNEVAFTDKVIYHYIQNENGQHKKGDYDPWNILTSNLKQYLVKNNDYNYYESTINSLALKAMSISFYRYSIDMSFRKASKEMKKKFINYSKDYNFKKINEDALDKSTITILKLAKNNCFFVIFLASKIRNIKQK